MSDREKWMVYATILCSEWEKQTNRQAGKQANRTKRRPNQIQEIVYLRHFSSISEQMTAIFLFLNSFLPFLFRYFHSLSDIYLTFTFYLVFFCCFFLIALLLPSVFFMSFLVSFAYTHSPVKGQ